MHMECIMRSWVGRGAEVLGLCLQFGWNLRVWVRVRVTVRIRVII